MTFVPALKESEIPEGEVRKAIIGKREFAIIRKDGRFFCIEGLCTHEGGPLGEGTLNDRQLVCPWHEGRYDIETGEADPDTDWITNAKTFPAKVEQGTVLIDV
jgi:nitrite reductase/ring-hydroxylating ferredoxin subunit